MRHTETDITVLCWIQLTGITLTLNFIPLLTVRATDPVRSGVLGTAGTFDFQLYLFLLYGICSGVCSGDPLLCARY